MTLDLRVVPPPPPFLFLSFSFQFLLGGTTQ